MKLIKNRIRLKKWLLYSITLIGFYCAFVLCYVWWYCYQSPLQGGKNGPLDAYRHTLASAVVAYTSTPKLVSIATNWMEYSNRPTDLMDQHNNAIGAKIGENASSLEMLENLVSQQINQGKINATLASQTTWMPQALWQNSLFW